MPKNVINTQCEPDIDMLKGLIVAKLQQSITEVIEGDMLYALLLVNQCRAHFDEIIRIEVDKNG